jgi:uncharacterized membrane protein YbhN (UPF0104 family)
MQPATSRVHPNRRYLLLVIVLLAGLYVLLPQFGQFRSSWHLLSHPDAVWTATAIGLTVLTYAAAAATYGLLAFKPLAYGQTLLVELAAMFINRLLPGGLGALGANYAYLRRNNHSAAQAAGTVAANNLFGVIGHGALVATALALSAGHVMASPPGHSRVLVTVIKIAAGVTVLAVVLGLVFGRHRLRQFAVTIRRDVLSYRQRPWRLVGALTSSIALTLCNVLCLACCGLALGVHLPFIAVLLIFSLGIGAGTATPTPGGLGGFEAGLTAGLIAYHVASPAALATALLYRLVSYWLLLPAGALALVVCQKKRLFLD